MKRINGFLIAILVSCAQVWAWTNPVSMPDVGDARIRVVGQNVQNYLSNLEASNSSCATQSDFEAKTNKIANAFIALKADIVTICEVQEDDEILGYITDEMNQLYGENVYTYITDNMRSIAQSGEYQNLKAGYIYRKDKVTPQGSSTSPYSKFPYKARMRIQTFKENSTGERFVLSINHFKAKDSSYDQGEATRLENASNLISALKNITSDPDILIMGDLNAYSDEQPILNLMEAGYEEQLLRYDPQAYSYIYKGQKGLIDHAMANSTMADQISGAQVYHINTDGGYYYKYSDHDACVVGLNLGKSTTGIENSTMTKENRKMIINGQLYIEYNGRIYDSFGRLIQ